MKKLIFPAVAALTLGLASCSSDEVNPGNGGGTVNYAEGGYVRLSINMPSVKGTRATTSDSKNDQFNDGLANEYAVKNATLVLFEGTNEATATFHSAYTLTTGMEMVGTSKDQITSMTKIVKKTDNKAHTGNLYALVVLNNNGLMEVTNDNKLVLKTPSSPTTTPAPTFSGTFSQFGVTLSTIASDATLGTVEGYVPAPKFASSVASKGIFMTNAPLSDKAGNTTNPNGAGVTTLVDVTNSVYDTEKEAQNAPAADIFVERGVAKVTFSLTESDGAGTGELDGAEFKKAGNEMDYEIIGWNLDVTNQQSYLVRQVTNTNFGLYSSDVASTGNKFRFVGSEKISAQTGGATTDESTSTTTTNIKDFYRIYWAEDPNYHTFVAPHKVGTSIVGSEEFNRLANSLTLPAKFEASNPQYCYENTFNVAHQKQNETTRVVIAIKLKHHSDATYTDLYAFNGDRSKLYKLTDAKSRIKDAIVNVLQEKVGFSSLAATGITDADITLTDRDPKTGQMAVKEFKATKAGETSSTTFAEGSDEVNAVNHELGAITEYVGGVAYYPVRIKHFGDDSTPWNVGTQGVTAGGIDKVYPDGTGAGESQDNRFLGRYGVLRNNWYNLSVGKVSGPGSPSIPDTEDIPDDELYNYISVRINILSWAKRNQHENL